MKMKKVLAAVLAGTMVLSLAACSKGGDSGEAPEKAATAERREVYDRISDAVHSVTVLDLCRDRN